MLTVEWLEQAQQCAVVESELLLADIHTIQVSSYRTVTSIADPDSFFTDPDPGIFLQSGSGFGSQ